MTTTPTAGSAAGIDLARLEQLAGAAEDGDYKAIEALNDAADPATVLKLIALARATPQPSADRAPADGAGELIAVADRLPHKATMVLATDGDNYALAYQRYDLGETVWYDARDDSSDDVRLDFVPTHWAEVPRTKSNRAPTAGDSATPQPIYATGGINAVADELEAEALNYEGDFADTVKGCAEALREIAATPQHSVAEQALTAAVDAAMVEMANISPPLRRSECARLIRAALAIPASTAASEQADVSVIDYGNPVNNSASEQQAGALSDAEIEAYFIAAGGRWADKSYWQIEDADLHPFVRSIAALTHRATTATSKDVQTTSKTAADQQDAAQAQAGAEEDKA